MQKKKCLQNLGYEEKTKILYSIIEEFWDHETTQAIKDNKIKTKLFR